MLFSSITFLYFFLPLVLLVYFTVPNKFRNAVLLIASLIFYFFGEPKYTVLLIISSISDWLHSLYIEKHRGTRGAKIALISSIVINLGMLGFFKYIDFIIVNLNALTGLSIPVTGIPLPIGISFFTFQTMSYTIDVYRGDAHAQKDPVNFATFVCLFPQLVAGPIVRYTDIAAELDSRQYRIADVAQGILRFAVGLGKKVLIANAMGEFCLAFRNSDDKSVLFYWLYAIAYSLQIYFDFSGYSDMAIGLGRIFGFSFPENFDYPFVSLSITEFWRRWHMTLGSWFRSYVYIPLGGNRVKKSRWLINILVVWSLTGFWHGAEWNFIVWGLYFGLFLVLEKFWLGKLLEKLPVILRRCIMFFIISISFVIFNAAGLEGMVADIGGLFGKGGLPLTSFDTLYNLKSYAVMLVMAIIGATPVVKKAGLKIKERLPLFAGIAQPVYIAAMVIFATAFIIDGSFNPFLYFRF